MCDDPDANAALQNLLVLLNETCQRMNAAKENPIRARMLETTWLLGDRLTFSNQVPRSVYLQLLGQAHLCGCLHVAYRSKDRIKGMYVICVLYESTLLLATADEDQPRYSTLAGIALANATVAECDNSKGLQCYTAPHSWKLVFEHSDRMYEFILVACSATEADVWRQHITTGTEAHIQAVSSGQCNVFELQSPLTEIPAALAPFGLERSGDGRSLVYTYDTQAERTGITGLLQALGETGIRFRDLQTEQSSLEDIFVGLLEDRA